MIAVLSVAYVGGTICMLSPDVPEEKILKSLSETQAQMHIREGDVVRTTTSVPLSAHDYPKDAEGFMLTTSGTTGYQKFIVHRHSVLFDYYDLIRDLHGIDHDSTVFCGPKIHWGYGFTIDLIPVLAKGATLAITDKIYSARKFCELLEERRATHLFTVPVMISLLVKGKPDQSQINTVRNLKQIFTAGDILPNSVRERFRKQYGRYPNNGWGQTEILSYAIIDKHDDDINDNHRSIGKVISGCEIRIEDGEMFVRSPCQAIGYLDDVDATNDTFHGEWVKTNDIVEMSGDHVIFKNRKGNRFKIRGEFYSVDDIEQEILNDTNVEECLVMAVEDKGILTLKISIVGENIHQDTIMDKLKGYRTNKDINIVKSLPKTFTNKKLRIA
jgi:acyl-coenzyme A synthetase/AMP-(fatty) acid ligase